jgi:hypothetical protein
MSPVNAFPANGRGFYDVFGNAWEWNIDFFSPLPGFEVNRLYEDFSTPCFDGLHHVIQGSSFISSGNEASVYSRYHFRPHFLQHASFRLVEQLSDRLLTSDTDSPGPYVGSYPFRVLESDMKKNSQANMYVPSRAEILNKYFGDITNSRFGSLITNMSALTSYRRIAELLSKVYIREIKRPLSLASVIDVGCGAGGLTLSLASQVKLALGIDHDSLHINLARDVAGNNIESYQFETTGGNLSAPFKLNVDSSVTDKSLVDFRQADPMCLPAELHGFDIVILNDVIDKVSAPNSVLGRLGKYFIFSLSIFGI